MMQGARLWASGYFASLLARFAESGDRIVECGGGPGWLGVAARESGMTYLGYELDPHYADTAAGSFQVDVRIGDFMETAEPADLVFMLQLVEHLWNPMDYFRKAYSLLRPGGKLIVATPNMQLGYLLLGLAQLSGRDVPKIDALKPPEHVTLFHPLSFVRVETTIGFERVCLTNNPHGLNPSGLRGVIRAAARLLVRPLAAIGLPLDSNLLWVGRKIS